MPNLKIADLNKIFSEAELADTELFAEQRSNCLLVAGEHFTKRSSKFLQRVRDSKDLSSESKIRLTKNHVSRIVKTYVSNILTHAPSTTILPTNENEVQDQKAAQLHNAVWQHIRREHKIRKKTRQWVEDFTSIGEVAVKIFWDPYAGSLRGYEPSVDELGQPILDQMGRPVPSDRPVFTGDLVFERVFGFNLLRAASAKSMDDSPYMIIRKMVPRADLKKQIESMPDGESKLAWLENAKDETFVVFDSQKGAYSSTKDEVMVKEYYFRPGVEYPNGYFYITVTDGVLYEGELPFGLWPIVYAGMDEIPTSPRCRSIIKQLRPYQSEINRAASMVAEHQITLGSDKILIQNGTKISSGGSLPGVRAYQYSGMKPEIMPGRSGEHLVEYINAQIAEMYSVAMLEEDVVEKDGQLDPYALLFRSMRHKKRFSTYAEKIEEFLTSVTETSIELYRKYAPEDLLVPAVGKNEIINITEFKNSQKLGYQIRIEPQSDDVETKLGKQIVLNHALQYVGNKLEKEDIGKMMRAMPYGNFEQGFADMTLDYDSAQNIILALDRGEYPPINKYDNHEYMMKRLVARQRMADFRFLPPQVQMMYEQRVFEHQQTMEANLREIKAAQADFVPTGGFSVVCDMYVSDPLNPGKTRRARLPYESLQWLIKRLEQQGSSLESLERMNQGAVADLARSYLAGNPAPLPDGMGGMGAVRGQESPGVMANGNGNSDSGGGTKQPLVGQSNPGFL